MTAETFAAPPASPFPDLQLASLESTGQADFLFDRSETIPVGGVDARLGVLAPAADEARLREWLNACDGRVYLGDAALLDAELIGRLAAEFGGERIGVYLPARRVEVSWSMDIVSNADFRVVTPSYCQPAFEVLLANGGRTCTLLTWWLGVMFEKGATSALLHLDLADDTDLNIAAGLVEEHGERLWFAALNPAAADFEQWVRWGQVRRLALGGVTRASNPSLIALLAPADERQVA